MEEKFDNLKSDSFSPNQIVGLVEMSLVTSELKKTATQLFETGILKKNPSEIKSDSLTFISSDKTTLLLSPVGRTWVFSNKQSKAFPQKILLDNYLIEVDNHKQIHVTKNNNQQKF